MLHPLNDGPPQIPLSLLLKDTSFPRSSLGPAQKAQVAQILCVVLMMTIAMRCRPPSETVEIKAPFYRIEEIRQRF